MINIGLVLLQKENASEASLYESFCLRRRSEVNLLPSGYPRENLTNYNGAIFGYMK